MKKKEIYDELAKKVEVEGYTTPSLVAINPEMRTGSWGAAATIDFEYIKDKIKKELNNQ